MYDVELKVRKGDVVIVLDPIEREALEKIVADAKKNLDITEPQAPLSSLQLKLALAIRHHERTS